MAVEVVANPYLVGLRGLCKMRVVKTTHKEQGKAVMYARFVIRVVLRAVLYYKDKALQFKSACGS